VHLARRVPEDSSAFRSFFRAPIRFNQELTALVFPARHLGLKVSTADPQLKLALERAVRELEAIARVDLVDELKRSLRDRLATSDCSCEEASRRFSVHRRTMNRRLKAAGTSFRTVLDELRFEVARQLVSDTELPLKSLPRSTFPSQLHSRGRSSAGPGVFRHKSGGIWTQPMPPRPEDYDRASCWIRSRATASARAASPAAQRPCRGCGPLPTRGRRASSGPTRTA
jgi:AraC-like DNA-binding protein